MKKALLIAEKPSLMRSIERVYKDHKSDIPYEISFIEQRGHLLTLKMPDELDEDLKDWSWDTLPIHPEEHGGWKYRGIEEKKVGSYLTAKERFKKIKAELDSGAYDFVINAGDADQEGQLLIRIVLAAAKCSLPIKRFWTNAVTESDILDALKNLKDDEHDPMLVNLLEAAYARQHSDWRYGINISRAATLKMGIRCACGRVKTPILSIVCQREKEIASFTPKTVYGVKATYSEDFSGQLYSEVAESEDEGDEKDENKGLIWFDTEAEALDLIKSLPKTGKVLKFDSKRSETYGPKLFKLATAQIAAGKLGYDSSQTLSIIQGLYEKGYITYPRTDCEFVASGENFVALLKSAMSVPELEPFVRSIHKSAVGKVKATKKWVNDAKLKEHGHSALTPTVKTPDFSTLSKEEQDIYTMICRQFVAIFLPPLIQNKTLLIADIGGKTFKSTGKTLVDAGYTTIFGTKFTDTVIPDHIPGDPIDVSEFDTVENTSKCPKRFTDADLIAVCEAPHKFLVDKSLKALGGRLKIGTPATRSNIIKELIDKDKYLTTKKEKTKAYIVPTENGMSIYDNLKDCDICKVDMTGRWEEELEKIRLGTSPRDSLEENMQKDVAAMVEQIKGLSIVPIRTKSVVIGKCPKCGGDLLSSDKGFYCMNFRSGCKIGAFKLICDSKLTAEEFNDLVSGKIIDKEISKNGKSWKQKLYYDFTEDKVKFKQAEKTTSSHNCPCCSKPLSDDGRSLSCDCGFKFWKAVCGKTITDAQIDTLFNDGDSGLIKGFKSKAGKSFDAHLVVNADEKKIDLKFD